MSILSLTKNTGDSFSASEFNQVISAINTTNDSATTNASSLTSVNTNISSLLTNVSSLLSSNTTILSNITSLNTSVALKANSADVYTKTVIDTKLDAIETTSLLVVSTTESEYGTINIDGTEKTLYRKLFKITGLPTTASSSSVYILDDSALGYNTYCNIDGYSVSDGEKLKSDFYNSIYTVSEIYVNDSLLTIAKIICNTNTTLTLIMYLSLVYVKPDLKEILFTVILPSGIDADSIELTWPYLKYDKKSIFTLVTDDCYTILNSFSNPIRGRKYNVGTGNWAEFVHTDGSGNDTNPYISDTGNNSYITPSYSLCFTDGCGIKRYPSLNVATWPATPNYMLNEWLDWADLKDFGNLPGYHNVWVNQTDDAPSSLSTFDTMLASTKNYLYTNIGIYTKTMVEPDGNHDYITYGKNNNSIDILVALAGTATDVYPFSSSFTLDKSSVTPIRDFASTRQGISSMNKITNMFSLSKELREWYLLGLHRNGNWDRGLILSLYYKYLHGGDDSLWMPTMDEMYEFWYAKLNSIISKTVSGQTITFTGYIPTFDNFYFNNISLLLSGIYSDSTTSVDTLTIEGVATKDGSYTITRNGITTEEDYVLGDTAKNIASHIRSMSNFTNSTLSGSLNLIIFTSTNSGIIDTPTFIDNSGSKASCTFTINSAATTAGIITFHLDYTDIDITYTTTASLTAISICDSIKNTWSSTPILCWDLDATTGTNTLIFTKLFNYTSDTGLFTDTGSTGVTATVSNTSGSNPSGIRGFWNRNISGLSMSSDNECFSYGIDSNTENIDKLVEKLTFTSGCTTAGNITILLDTSISNIIAITTAYSTPILLAAYIATQTFTGFTVSYTSGNDYIIFSANNYGVYSNPSLTVNSTGVVGSFSITTEGKDKYFLVNLDYSSDTSARAEKYISRYESNLDLNKLRDAQYFVDMLKPGTVKTTFLQRIDTYAAEPTLTSILLEGGSTTTNSRLITVAFTTSGGTPTLYMLSENGSFTDALWDTYLSSVLFEFSDVLGSHTIYAKLKNDNGISERVSSSITYAIDTLVLSTVSINSGASTTTSRTVSVSYTYTGSTPTYYMISEDSTFADVSWIAISSTISFTLSSGSGSKTIYLKLKNSYYTTSSANSSITYSATVFGLSSISINNGDANTSSKTVSAAINYSGDTVPTGYKIGEDSTLSNETSYTTYSSSPVSYTFSSYGSKTLYCLITDGTNVSSILSDGINIILPVVLSVISINSGATSTSTATVSVVLTFTGTPTYYMISESSTFVSGLWVAYTSSTLSYTFATSGSKTLYVKLMNSVTTSTDILSASITYTSTTSSTVVLANITSSGTTLVSNITDVGYVNNMRWGFTDAPTLKYLDNTTFAIGGGKYTGYFATLLNALYARRSITGINSDNGGAYWGFPTLSTIEGDYPNSIITSGDSTNNSVLAWASTSTLSPETNMDGNYITGVPSGTYTVRFLFSESTTKINSYQSNSNDVPCYIRVNDTVLALPLLSVDKTWCADNNSVYETISGITVSDGFLDIITYAQYPTVGTNATSGGLHAPGLVLIEITKTA